MAMLPLAAAQGNGTSATFPALRGDVRVSVWGTWSGATAKLQSSPDGGTSWIDIPGATFTADGTGVLSLTPDELVRLNVAGGGSPSINVSVGGVGLP